MTTFEMCRKSINTMIKRGTLDVHSMTVKLDVFLMGDRITAEQYTELAALMVKCLAI